MDRGYRTEAENAAGIVNIGFGICLNVEDEWKGTVKE